MTSATEAELAALYIMAREAVYIILILDEMGHKQPPTPLKTDYAMVEAVINGIVQQQKNKINMGTKSLVRSFRASSVGVYLVGASCRTAWVHCTYRPVPSSQSPQNHA